MSHAVHQIDDVVYQAHFADEVTQLEAHKYLLLQAQAHGIFPASIYPIYNARGVGRLEPNFTVPAFNLRGPSYLLAQAAFEAALDQKVGLVIFELARSEMKYTYTNPFQLASSVIGAAIKTGYKGPIFIQGDHYQPKASRPGVMKAGEVDSITQLIKDSIAAGIYNIDIDGSTLVIPDDPTEYDQQRPNFLFTAAMLSLITALQPAGIRINTGCEISEVGTHLSKSSQLSAFMTGLVDEGGIQPLEWPTKVAIETGTAHGGKVLRDGSAGDMYVDFDRLKTISMIARKKYQMAGAVQHGASTLDKDVMSKFPEYEACEIHLSTGFQNTILDHPAFPQDLIDTMYTWCDINCKDERKPEWSDAQFYAKMRKKAWGPFKKQVWELPKEKQEKIKNALREECAKYFKYLNVENSFKVTQYTF